jgi:hypothetical protein
MEQDRMSQPRLHIVPIKFRQACDFVDKHHRHHKRPQGHIFSIGVADEHDTLRGVAMIGRPVARHYDNGTTLEVNRTATDGTPNANSCLYGAAWRATRALGYQRLITYTHSDETGSSLRAAGYKIIGERKPRAGWNAPSRARTDKTQFGISRRVWEIAA